MISACFIFSTGQSIDSVKSMLLLHSSSNADRPICVHTQKSTSDIYPLRSYAVQPRKYANSYKYVNIKWNPAFWLHSPCGYRDSAYIHMDCVAEKQGFTLCSHICSYLHTCEAVVIGVLFCMHHCNGCIVLHGSLNVYRMNEPITNVNRQASVVPLNQTANYANLPPTDAFGRVYFNGKDTGRHPAWVSTSLFLYVCVRACVCFCMWVPACVCVCMVVCTCLCVSQCVSVRGHACVCITVCVW